MSISFKRTYLVACGILLAGLCAYIFWYSARQPSANAVHEQVPVSATFDFNVAEDTAQARQYWLATIQEKGAHVAYAELTSTYQTASVANQHMAAHTFGRLLYDSEGADGIRVCDATFAFGCFHGFFGAAVGSSGLEQITALDQACVSAFGKLGTGCQHGLGHGLMEYFGPERLYEALAACQKTTQPNPLFGCTSGVFMEYNIPTIISDSAVETTPRTFDVANPLDSCATITNKNFRLSCLHELPQWWQHTTEAPTMAQWCATLVSIPEQEACMVGLGDILAVQSNFVSEDVIGKCEQLALLGSLCKAGAAWSFFAQPASRPRAKVVCGNDQVCLNKALVICNFMQSQTEKQDCFAGHRLE